jgi:hypothetical protein
VTIDRQHIERRDFPLASEGYAREAVDAHLAAIADDLAAMEPHRSTPSLAEEAAARVRAIVGEAEARGAEIAREADESAERTRQDTEREMARVREQAVQRTRAEVREIVAALERMGQELTDAERETNRVLSLLRQEGDGLREALSLIDREMDRAYDALRAEGDREERGAPPGAPAGAQETS